MNTSRLVFAGVWLGPLIIASPLLATLISLDNSVPLVVNVKEIPDNPPAPTVDRKALTVKLAKALDKIQASALAAKSSNDLTDLFEQVREWQRSPGLDDRQRERLNAASNFLNNWSNYLDAGAEDNPVQQMNVLNNLIGNNYQRFADTAKLRAVRDELRKTFDARINRRMAALVKNIGTADSADDFSKLSDEMEDLRREFNYSQQIDRKINRYRHVIDRAMNVLDNLEGRHFREALQYIRELDGNRNADAVLPKGWLAKQRAAVLDKMSSTDNETAMVGRPIERWFADYHKTRDLNALIRQVTIYLDSLYDSTNRHDVADLRDVLRGVRDLQLAIESNSFTNFQNNATFRLSKNPWSAQADALYQEALTAGIVKFYELKDFPQQIKKGERATDALIRLAHETAGQRDWARCFIYLNAIRDVSKTCNGRFDFENLRNACNYYLQGNLLRDAGENELAIQLYQKVLAISGDPLPRKEAIAAIKQLREAAPTR